MMPDFGSGIDAQIGLGEESVFGTAVPVDTFYEFNSESIVPEVVTLASMPLGTGRLQRTSRVRTYVKGAGGDFEINAVNRGLGPLLKQMFGAVASAQVLTTTEYTHTFTPSANGKRGLSATVQKGVPSTDGTINPFTYAGGKITGWQMAAALDDILKITTTWDFASLDMGTAIATPSYAVAPEEFTFLDGTLSIGGTAISDIKNVSLAAAEAMDTDREYFGNTRGEPLANGELAYTGQLDSEFNDMDAFNAWVAGTEIVNAVITFTGNLIPTEANPYKLVVTIPSLKYTGEAPQVGGPEIVQQNLPFKALYNGTDEIITAVYHTDDVTV